MKTHIDSTSFGSITIEGQTYDYDVAIKPNGEIIKRKKKLSKKIYGTSHVVSEDEIKFILEKGTKQIIVGSGQNGILKLSDEAKDFLKHKGIDLYLKKTPEACDYWNTFKGKAVGLFHITC